jgi:hypothetical protein
MRKVVLAACHGAIVLHSRRRGSPRRKLDAGMGPNSARAADVNRAQRRSAKLREQASALLAAARRIVHDVRNSRLEAQILRRTRKP